MRKLCKIIGVLLESITAYFTTLELWSRPWCMSAKIRFFRTTIYKNTRLISSRGFAQQNLKKQRFFVYFWRLFDANRSLQSTKFPTAFLQVIATLPLLMLWHHNPSFQDGEFIKCTVPMQGLIKRATRRIFSFRQRTN